MASNAIQAFAEAAAGYAIAWDDTASWVQAIGSMAALAVAIQVDRNATRRLRDDREAEWSKQREERERAASDARRARMDAVRNCVTALDSVAMELRALELPQIAPRSEFNEYTLAPEYLSGLAKRRLSAARTALRYRLQRPGEVEGDVMAVLALAEQTMSAPFDTGRMFGPLHDAGMRDAVVDELDEARFELIDLLAEYEAGVL